jgi:hypothetical protein
MRNVMTRNDEGVQRRIIQCVMSDRMGWTLLCKTPNCRTLCVIQFADIMEPRIPVIPASIPNEFEYVCSHCGEHHHYMRSDVELKTIPPSVN